MTRVVADTTCGLPPDVYRRLDIPMIPQVINFGADSFREGVDIDAAGFMAKLRAGKDLPKTAAPYPGDFIEVFKRFQDAGESMVCIHPSADVSGTVRSAEIAQQDFPGADIRIIDTRTIAGPLASIVLEADALAKKGASADEVEALARSLMPRARIYFLVDTLEFLRRGGRIGGASALVGTVLQIKPILTFREGRVDQFEKERTRKKALARIKELIMAESARGPEARITVMHADARAEAEEIAADLRGALGTSEVPVMDLVPAIITHAGPGALAFGFFTPA
ncbi:MAG: DegV family protein [Anaerolineae bacterium]|jgi:DegV family protein with EDD domain|nr:DegV family protein [Anaerolineae bacterium]